MNSRSDDWSGRKHEADKYTPDTMDILGKAFPGFTVMEAPIRMDRREAIDLVLIAPNHRIHVASRVRSYKDWFKYGGQFTIRDQCQNPKEKTELEKIESGFVNYLFYGFASPHNNYKIHSAVVLDAQVFRDEWKRDQHARSMGQPGHLIWTKERKDLWFLAFTLSSFPARIIRYQHGPTWEQGCGLKTERPAKQAPVAKPVSPAALDWITTRLATLAQEAELGRERRSASGNPLNR